MVQYVKNCLHHHHVESPLEVRALYPRTPCTDSRPISIYNIQLIRRRTNKLSEFLHRKIGILIKTLVIKLLIEYLFSRVNVNT